MISDEREYLTFNIKEEEFGVDILYVQEIRVWESVTELPNKPAFIKGVINLRGVITPIIDLRQRFNIEPLKYNAQTVIIILRAQDTQSANAIGIVVDSVSDVYKVDPKTVRSAPEFGSHIDSCFISALATIANKLIVLLDTPKLLEQSELYGMADNEDLLETTG